MSENFCDSCDYMATHAEEHRNFIYPEKTYYTHLCRWHKHQIHSGDRACPDWCNAKAEHDARWAEIETI